MGTGKLFWRPDKYTGGKPARAWLFRKGWITLFTAGADSGKNLTGLLESEHRIYGSPEACSSANGFRIPLSKIDFDCH